jgi:hypothetical protein
LIALISRVGTVLIALSLVLYVVSLIPPASDQSTVSNAIVSLQPGEWTLDCTPSIDLLNPQKGIQILIENNETLSMKLFSLNYLYVREWVTQRSSSFMNETLLEEFANSHSNYLIEKQDFSSGKTVFEYIPSKLENATVIVSNPNAVAVSFYYESQNITVIAASERIFPSIMTTALVGIALAVPKIVLVLKEKRDSEENASATH